MAWQYLLGEGVPEEAIKYEPYRIELAHPIPYIPDFWLPKLGIIVEAKGLIKDSHEKSKIVATHRAMPIVVDGVHYHKYIVAVSASYREIDAYDAANGMCSALSGIKTRYMPLSGLGIVKWCNANGVTAVPVADGRMDWLKRRIKYHAERQRRHDNGV